MSDLSKRFEVLYDLKRYEELLHVSMPLCATKGDEQLDAFRYSIMALIQCSRYPEALACVHEALGSFPLEGYFLYLKTYILFETKAYKAARELIDVLLSCEPNSPVYHHLHAQILVELSLYVEAKHAIDKALALDALNSDYQLTLALIIYYLGNTPIACEIIQNVLSHSPHHPYGLHLHSVICTISLSERGKIFKAILFQNPFDVEGKEQYEGIKRYYQLAPFFMGIFALYLLGERFEMWQKSEYSSVILLLLACYLWRDWRLSVPFFASMFIMMGDLKWHEWHVAILGALLYYFVGRLGGELFSLAWQTVRAYVQKGKRWMNR